MSDMVERVARAMMRDLERQGEPYGAGPLYDRPDTETPLLKFVVIDGTVDMLELARAAIAEMREPTVEMVRAATVDPLGKYVTPNHAALVWQLMIDAALKEDGTKPR